MLITPLDGQELVALPGAAALREGPVIYISHRELVFNEEQLATLVGDSLDPAVIQGHVILPLYEKLEEEGEKYAQVRAATGRSNDERVATLVVDARSTFASTTDIMYTCDRLDYEHFDFVVEPVYPVRRALRASPPPFATANEPLEDETAEGPPFFKVFILNDGYRVTWGQSEALLLPKLDPKGRTPAAWDQAGLARLARERKVAAPQLRQATIAAEHAITMDVVLATGGILLGPDCMQHDGSGCMLPELILEAGAG